ncbi:hypothetical protein MetexDRAFT_4627 [Methylorubrum extorquens DSM 13060]|jgi:hypothetical protein|uniref:Uncharacterized protein n=1 Tax=Methylorubrum extorquens DSM 13060 TaxID=882800 RepID=H1KPQ1_METEX|nr:hypothetical protein MetexDRAFT_4627 [Methylorubrum extorquens DSM 13060]
MKLDSAAPVIAQAISGFIVPYKHSPKTIREYYATCLRQAVRQFEMFVTPLVSRAAQDRATALGLGDLSQYRWLSRNRIMENGAHIFHWEHAQTVGHMSRMLTSMEDPTLPKIEAVVRSAVIVWVLKTEDAELRRLGYNTNRPDWRAAYAAAGIEVLHRAEGALPGWTATGATDGEA